MGKHNFDYDFIVIGSGTAGSASAMAVANAGRKVAIIESNIWGGLAPNFRDIPYRAALNFSHTYFNSKNSSKFGISSKTLRFNYPTALNSQSIICMRAGTNDKRALTNAKVTCLSGHAHFLTPYELSVGNKRISAPNILIATGSLLDTGNISGIETCACLTPDTALKLPHLPKSIFIVGAGSTGCELAQYFAELGVEVSLAETSGRILPREDEEVGACLNKYFNNNLGIKVLTQSRVISIQSGAKGYRITMIRGGREKSFISERVVLATGAKPNLDLGLSNAGVLFSQNGISVNNYLQTSIKHIFAAGDILGGESSAELAAYQGGIVAANILNRSKTLVNYDGFIRHIDTYPQVASVGLTEEQCLARGLAISKSVLPLSAIPAANIFDFNSGFIKLISDRMQYIIGATVVSPEAELVIQEIAMAIRHHFTAVQLASAPHVSSGWGELVRIAARKFVKKP